VVTKKALEGLINLTAKEAEVVYYKCQPLSHADIAAKLGKSENVVNEQSSSAIRKLGIPTVGKTSDQILLSLTEYYETLQKYVKIPNEVFKSKQSWMVIVRQMNKDLGPVGEPEPEEPEEKELEKKKVTEEPQPELGQTQTTRESGTPEITQPREDIRARDRRLGLLIGGIFILLVCGGIACYRAIPIIESILDIFRPPVAHTIQPVAALPSLTPTDTPLPSFTPTVTLTPTETQIPTITPTPTDTLTPTFTPMFTFTPTQTPFPDELYLGDKMSDGRVSMELYEVLYHFYEWAVVFRFRIKNLSSEDILFLMTHDHISSFDNTDRNFDCRINYWSYVEQLTIQLQPEQTIEFGIRCGARQTIQDSTEWIKLEIDEFTSLPAMTWVAEIPR
jgi:DNA-binding CsgD family transcriptional regulator